MPKPSAHIQEAVCASLAPRACAAEKTMAAELVNPTSTATKPATTVDRDASLSHFFNMGVSHRSLVPDAKISVLACLNAQRMVLPQSGLR
jgi:hypothetical protein